jgi:ABC-type lipoprotein release transport system permease subunit
VSFTQYFVVIRASATSFIRAPVISLALLFTISLGVGSNASVYGFVQGLTHPYSPFHNSEGIVSILARGRSRATGPFSRLEFRLLQKSVNTFEWVEAAQLRPRDVAIGDHTEIAIVADLTSNLAKMLNLPLRDGIIISHRVWQSDLGSRPDFVGRRIRIGNLNLPISGVAPAQLEGLYSDQPVDLWMSSQDKTLQGEDLYSRDLWILARIRNDVSIIQAQAAVRSNLGEATELNVIPFSGASPEMSLGLSRIGTLLNIAASALFLVASINVASFLFARALKRSHETSLRLALGATRNRLIAGLLSDSLVISLVGGIPGLLVAISTARILPALLFEEDAERLIFAPHVAPTITAALLCVCITVVCGMMPVFATDTDRPWIILRRDNGMSSKGLVRIRTLLVLGQIVSCYTLVIFAIFLFESLHSALETSEGHLLGKSMLVTVQAQSHPGVDLNYFDEVERTARMESDLTPLAWTAQLPGNQPVWRSFRVDLPSPPLRKLNLDIVWLGSNSLGQIDSRPIAGRLFGRRDPSRRDAVVDEDAATQLFGRETVGRVIQDPSGAPVEIIGIVNRKPTDGPFKRRATIYYDYTNHSSVPDPIPQASFRAPIVSPLISTELSTNFVSPGYFKTFGLSLVSGRQFPDRLEPGAFRIGIINQEAADLFFSGKSLGAGIIDEQGVRTEVVGIAQSKLLGAFQQHAEPTIYFPMQQDPSPRMTLILQGSELTIDKRANLRRKVELIPGRAQAPIIVQTLDDRLAQSAFAPLRIAVLLCTSLAILALLLSGLGLFIVQHDAERQRQRELALRIALGSQRWRIAINVLSSAARLAFVGTVIGALLSFGILRLLVSEISIVRSPSLRIWLVVALLPTAMLLMASALPALRASLADPLTLMRDDN